MGERTGPSRKHHPCPRCRWEKNSCRQGRGLVHRATTSRFSGALWRRSTGIDIARGFTGAGQNRGDVVFIKSPPNERSRTKKTEHRRLQYTNTSRDNCCFYYNSHRSFYVRDTSAARPAASASASAITSAACRICDRSVSLRQQFNQRTKTEHLNFFAGDHICSNTKGGGQGGGASFLTPCGQYYRCTCSCIKLVREHLP